MSNIIDTPTRIRTTAATQARIGRILKLIEALRLSPLSTFEICDLLGVTPSGSRKYTLGLVGQKIVFVTKAPAEESCKRPKAGATVSYYNLIKEEGLIEKYIADISNIVPYDTALRIPKDKREPAFGHHIYRITHDAEFRVRAGKNHIPARDPLLAALFGPPTVK